MRRLHRSWPLLVALVACGRSSSRSSAVVAIDPPAGTGAMAPNLAAAADGVWLSWLEPIGDATSHRLRAARFERGRWTAPVTIAEGTAIMANWADVPSMIEQDSRTVVAHWAEKSADGPYAYDVVLGRSTDRGATWKRLGLPHRDGTRAEHGFVSLVRDRDGVLAVWLDGRATGGEDHGATALRAARVGDTIGAEEVIDDRVCDCCSTSGATTSDGPAIVYRDRSGDELRDIAIARRAAGTWSTRGVHADDWRIAGCPVNGPALAADGQNLVVAWYTYAEQRGTVRVAFSSDAGATFGEPIEVDVPHGSRAPIGRVDVVLARSGDAIVSWMASERDQAQLLLKRVARDGRRGTEVEIARLAAGRDAGFPKLAPTGDDLLVAWSDARAGALHARLVSHAAVPRVVAMHVDALPATATPLPIGSRLPPYAAASLDGTATAFAPGEPVLINVWATWCEPCRRELPALAALQERHRGRVRVIAISVDRDQPRDRVAALANRFAPGLEIWHDRDDRASGVFGVANLPATLLFDRRGVLVWRHDGAITADDAALAAAIDKLPP